MRLTIEWIAAPAASATDLDSEAEAVSGAARVANAATPATASGAPGTESAANVAGAAIGQDAEGHDAKPWRVRL